MADDSAKRARYSPLRLGWTLVLSAILVLLVGACSFRQGTVVITATPAGADVAPSPTSLTPEATPLESDTGSYLSATALLDGICFEFLDGIAGEAWTWTSAEDLGAFYDRMDESEQCAGVVPRGSFDFSAQMLVGGVSAATGCDAAHRFVRLEEQATAQRYIFELVITPGCDYELVEPLLIAVPRPSEGVQAELRIVTP